MPIAAAGDGSARTRPRFGSPPATPAAPGCARSSSSPAASLKGQLKHADRLGARYVAIVGDQSGCNLKDMESGEQRELEPAAVIPTILRGSRLA